MGKTKSGKSMNPTDAYRKEQRKKELKKVCCLNANIQADSELLAE